MRDVLLVCMPFGPVFFPAIGLSLLRAGLARRRISCRVRYFSIDFAERIGQDVYCDIADAEGGPPAEYLVGEWIFSAALNGLPPTDGEAYVEEILLNHTGVFGDDPPCSPAFVRRTLEARRKAAAFLEDCLAEVLCEEPKILGFTTVFQQHAASLALARAVKQARQETTIVFGGANCEGVMGAETLRRFPFIDAVVSGEGDIIFPELVRRVLGSEPIAGLQGIRTPKTIEEESRSGHFSNAPMVANLDDLPYPDYDDFFQQFSASRYDREWQPSVPFETSRGCWWGERRHCTFCGLNGTSLQFRSKSAARAVEELAALVARHPGADVDAVDNVLDMNHFSTFLPALARRRLDASVFYETKSNLKKHHVRMLRDAGVQRIQPGIESLSDPVLGLIRKGVTALQNIQLLKWCKELGVQADWNFLWGFPGESPDEYARMAALVPRLTHLRPPTFSASLRLDRFSPIFSNGVKAGITHVEPVASYGHVYRLPPDAIANMAYYFTFRYCDPQDVGAYVAPLRREIRKWRKAARRSDLFAVDVGGRLVIWDLRPAFRVPITVLTGIDRALYLACDATCDLRRLAHLVSRLTGEAAVPPDGTTGRSASMEDIRARLDWLVARGLAVKQGTRYLALAVPLGDYSPPPEVVEHVYGLVRLLGHRRAGAWIIPLDAIGDRPVRLASLRRALPRAPPKPRQRWGQPLTPTRFSITDLGELAIR